MGKPYKWTFKSLKTSVALMLVLVTMMLAAISFAIANFYSQQVILGLIKRLESDINVRVNVELDRIFDNAERVTRINWAMMKDGVVESKDPEEIGKQLLNVVKTDASVDFAYFSNERGGAVIAGREAVGFSLLTTKSFLPGGFNYIKYDEYGNEKEKGTRENSYFDARTREWYKNAFSVKDVYWSGIYEWAQEAVLGITVSKPYYYPDGSKGGVFASDLRLSKIHDFLKRLYVSPNGCMYLIQENGLLIAATKGEAPSSGPSRPLFRVYARASENLLIREAQRTLEREIGPLSTIKTSASRRLDLKGEIYYVMIEPYVFNNIHWYKVLVIPVSDFDSQVSEFKKRYLLVTVMFLLIASFLGILMARRIIRPIIEVTSASEKLAEGFYDYRISSGRQDEIGRLEIAFNTMAEEIKKLLDSLNNKNRELLVFNQRLERMVVERTKDLEVRATTDEMTGIRNYKSLKDKLETLQKRHDDEGIPFSVVMIDLDHFKRINDTYGHQVGDGILRAFSNLIRSGIREGDVFGRYGGEEFMLIFPGAPLGESVAVCERLREMVEAHNFLGEGIRVTASFGVAEADHDGVEELVGRADQQLYEAKHAGRNRVAY